MWRGHLLSSEDILKERFLFLYNNVTRGNDTAYKVRHSTTKSVATQEESSVESGTSYRTKKSDRR